ncbi:M28 family metallopeptidase [Flagellimonas meridianipacifica]|uniref:Peptidase M28-like protein n=1 Tax=Flagellimonas meridianipacifica TaxID=1080225 RepID=A0A2T0M843_9FLAO|nr:M20/M25/M40 family metallo-hydrolase [Allomuricauda pacifica]PRX53639.1 peptidase M28-like protein [Allomuricauda pacifica]
MNLKKLVWVVLFVVSISCKSTQGIDRIETDPINPTWKPSAQNMGGPEGLKADKDEISKLAFVDTEAIEAHMSFLASDDLKGRDSGSEGIEKAAQYIEGFLQSNQVAPYYESYRDTLTNYKRTSYNVLGVVEGSDPELKKEYIMIGAHYDHIGIIKIENGDAIANGANDNASGTTSVLELARYFGTRKTNKRTLIFALFSAEEKGLLGSKHMAKNMKQEGLNLYAMLNFEMTGVPLRGKDYLTYITGYKKSNLAEVINRYAEENLVGFLPTAKEFNLFQRSDNYPFYQEFGVPSHTFCTFDFTNFMFYHRVGDENELMDFEHMATLVNKLIPVVENISNAPTQVVKAN